MIELKIVMNDTGQLKVTGPLDNAILCYGLLEAARDVVAATAQKKKQSSILAPVPGAFKLPKL